MTTAQKVNQLFSLLAEADYHIGMDKDAVEETYLMDKEAIEFAIQAIYAQELNQFGNDAAPGEDKLYTQSDLNNAVTKAITDMSKVLTAKDKAIAKACQLLKDGYCVECNGLCAFSNECHIMTDGLTTKKLPCEKSAIEWREYLERSAENDVTRFA